MAEKKENSWDKVLPQIITAIATAVCTIILIKPFERAWAPSKQLSYHLSPQAPLLRASGHTNLLFHVTPLGTSQTNVAVGQVSAYRISVWNSGTETVENAALRFATADSARIFTIDGPIDHLRFGGIQVTNDAEDGVVVWTLGYLNPGLLLRFTIIAEGTDNLEFHVGGKGFKLKRERREPTPSVWIGFVMGAILSLILWALAGKLQIGRAWRIFKKASSA
jgi:hypothetical protein